MSSKFDDRFTERARRVLMLAQEEARRLNDSYIGTEHLLLGLVQEERGVAARVLRDMGVNPYQVRRLIEESSRRAGHRVRGEATGLTPRTKRVMFLRTCVGELGLDQIDVKRVRSDALPAGGAEAVVARATLPPPEWLAEGARLATQAVWVLLAREPAPSHPAWVVDHDVSYTWPFTGVARRALRYVPVR